MIPGQSSSYRTKLGLFWFGGGKDDESKKRKGEAASGFGGVAQVMDSMENFKKAQQVGKITEGILQELSSMSVEGSAEDGKVRVFFDGTQRPKSVDIDETYMSSVEADDLEAALAAAMKDAHAKSKEKMEEKMKSFYAELGLASSANNS
jgi:DNA-binding YbaB/EbfC family protein